MPAQKRRRITKADSSPALNYLKKSLYFDLKKFPYSKYGRGFFKRGTEENLDNFGPSYNEADERQKSNRERLGYRGKGKYSFGKFMRKSGLAKVGRNIITAAGDKAVASIAGMGMYGGQGLYTNKSSYNTMDNQLIDGGMRASKGYFSNDEQDSITISDTEYIKDIYAPTITTGPGTSSGFASQLIETNPGLASFAPNLSQIAANFTEVEYHQLIFELKPVLSENNVNNGQSGTGMMVFNYDASSGNPYDNKEDVMQTHGAVSARLTEGMRCGVECDPAKTKNTEFFIRTGPVPFQRDADEFDLGNLVVCTNNIPAEFSNRQIYELYVYYTVTLRKRKPGAIRLNNQQKDLFVCAGDVGQANFPQNQFIGGRDGILASQQNNIGGLLTSPGQSRLIYTFPPDFNGFVEVRLFVEGATMGYSGTPGIGSLPATGTITPLQDIYGSVSVAGDLPTFQVFNVGTTQFMYVAHLRVKSVVGGTPNSFQLDTTLNAGTVAGWQFEIVEITNNHFFKPTIARPILINQVDGQVYVP